MNSAQAQFEGYEDHYVQNGDVKLHYVSKGQGDVMIFLHGFPDFWFTWKHQMDALSNDYQVIGPDLRAYNYSEGPDGVNNYQMTTLMSDLVAIIDNVSDGPVTLVANDWGGAIAWLVATYYPGKVKQLIACNIPNPAVLTKHLSENPETGGYTKSFTADKAVDRWTPEELTKMAQAQGTDLEKHYLEAFRRSNIKGMLDYYKASYPQQGSGGGGQTLGQTPTQTVQCPVLMIHGLKDQAFPPPVLNDHWELVPEGLTIHTIPTAGHFVQRDAPSLVLKYIQSWLKLQANR